MKRRAVWSFQTRALPDNRYLYARAVGNNTDIYSSNETGANLVRLTSAMTVETAPQLSPNRDGTGLTLLATAPAGRHFRECDWRPPSKAAA